MGWFEFLQKLESGFADEIEYGDLKPPPGMTDDHYVKWVRHVTGWLAKRATYPIHRDERDLAARAVREGLFKWTPDPTALLLGPNAWPRPTAPRDPYDEWIENVQRYFERAVDPYPVAEHERAWAERAVTARVFEWEMEPVT